LYRDNSDPGLHGAAGWLLRHWGQRAKVEEIDRELATGNVEGQRQWYVNGQGQTLVLVRPGEFETMEGDKPLKVRVERRFALAAREVTVAEFRRFRKNHRTSERARTEDCPVSSVFWYDAAAYCNWLSKEEGIPEDQWCYEPNTTDQYGAGMRVKPDALSLAGYRLPTKEEWEYACRAGSVTAWSMGEAMDLLPKYAWFAVNSLGEFHPVGSLRPNDLGLFDLHGNVWEWCQNRIEDSKDMRDRNIDDKVDNKSLLPVRGGDFTDSPWNLLSARDLVSRPGSILSHYGFRPARTFR
jgi:formylglycine-generating enzyme required for sulfatase activity